MKLRAVGAHSRWKVTVSFGLVFPTVSKLYQTVPSAGILPDRPALKEIDVFYYKRNIGDYHKKAGRLSMLEHGAYTLLMDSCYDREQFPTEEEAIDWCWARTTEEVEAVKFVLTKFFTLKDDVYMQKHIQEVVDKYHSTALINKRIAEEREKNRRENKTKRERSVNEAPPNQEPRTTNQEPLTIEKKGGKPRFAPPAIQEIRDCVSDHGYAVDPEAFFFHYEGNGWMVGKNKMKNWKMALASWNKRESNKPKQQGTGFNRLMELAR